MNRYVDMHCHLDFCDNPRDVSARAAAADSALFSCSVTPAGYLAAKQALDGCLNVRVGLGMHPWWVATGEIGEEEAALFDRLAARERYLGEVGLDFGKRHEHAAQQQVSAFERAVRACAEQGKVMSVHAVRSADVVLDMLESSRAHVGSACVLHWFSGSSAELVRARDLGFFFSVNAFMLATRRGREYLKAIPLDRLLVETDLPEQGCGIWSHEQHLAGLEGACSAIAEIRGEAALERAFANGTALLEL